MSTAAASSKPANAAAEAAYQSSCKELQTAIGSLESSLAALVGKDNLQGEAVFAHTKARLAAELSTASSGNTNDGSAPREP